MTAQTLGRESVDRSRQAGRATGAYLAGLGVNVDFAPVLDVPDSAGSFLGSRAFGQDPATVTSHGVAFIPGLQRQGVAATAKHFPGLGTARANTDLHRVDVTSSRAELERRLEPFRAATKANVKLMMVSNASYSSLDPSRRAAALSPAIVETLLRHDIGYRGVVVTDTMSAPGLLRYAQPELNALRAGVDVLLYSDNEAASARAYRQLVADARSGALRRATLEHSYQRVQALKQWLEKRS